MFHGKFSESGELLGLYQESVEGSAPLTEEEYKRAQRGELVRDLVGDRWTAKPALSAAQMLQEARQGKEVEIRREGSARLKAIVAPYSAEERESWHKQEREARAWLADSSAGAPMLAAMAAARGISLGAMVDKVMENVEAFEAAAGTILGTQQALLDQLAAIDENHPDPLSAVEAISW